MRVASCQSFCINLAKLDPEMRIRTAIGNGIRAIVGKNLYTRLRIGSRAEHSFLGKVRGVIHVGANAGQERELYGAFGLDVIWIEPIPEVFERLQANISQFPKQRAFRYLVTDQVGKEHELHIADNSGASSSIFDFDKHVEMYPHIAYKGSITMRGTTLGSILTFEKVDIQQYDAVVLDTQGSELNILNSAEALLPNFRFVKVEVPDFESYKGCCQIAELSAFMFSQGFRERSRHPITHAPGIGTYFDVVYERNRR